MKFYNYILILFLIEIVACRDNYESNTHDVIHTNQEEAENIQIINTKKLIELGIDTLDIKYEIIKIFSINNNNKIIIYGEDRHYNMGSGIIIETYKKFGSFYHRIIIMNTGNEYDYEYFINSIIPVSICNIDYIFSETGKSYEGAALRGLEDVAVYFHNIINDSINELTYNNAIRTDSILYKNSSQFEFQNKSESANNPNWQCILEFLYSNYVVEMNLNDKRFYIEKWSKLNNSLDLDQLRSDLDYSWKTIQFTSYDSKFFEEFTGHDYYIEYTFSNSKYKAFCGFTTPAMLYDRQKDSTYIMYIPEGEHLGKGYGWGDRSFYAQMLINDRLFLKNGFGNLVAEINITERKIRVLPPHEAKKYQ